MKTIKEIESGNVSTKNQDDILNGRQPKLAYKIFKDTCVIKWSKSAEEVHNHIRGLSPYPAAFTTLKFPDGKLLGLKIFKTQKSDKTVGEKLLQMDGKKELFIGCKNGALKVLELQLAGKKRMPVASFIQGVNLEGVEIV